VDFLTPEFLSSLLAIIAIDLMLAGDNAIVIALAARNVPQHLQKKAIMWGMVGAIVIRISMTVIVVWLLNIPGLQMIGGALLIVIAYRLLLPVDEAEHEEHANAASSFWGAMRTIVIADAIMGLDNILAVAGAAQGDFLLVIIGLLVSIPIVIWGSSLILRGVDRYPSIVYFGAAILAWTAAKMISGEPLLAEFIAAHGWTVPLAYVVIIASVLLLGFIKNAHWIEEKVSARLKEMSQEAQNSPYASDSESQTGVSQRILVPIDDSIKGLNAIHSMVNRLATDPPPEVHLAFVRHPFSLRIDHFMGSDVIENYYSQEAEKAFKPCREMLEQKGIPFFSHIEKGEKAEAIAASAERLHCDLILICAPPAGTLARMFQTLLTNRVMGFTKIPVEVLASKKNAELELQSEAA